MTWYALKDDATDGSTIAGQGEQQAKAVWLRREASSEESSVDMHGMVARAGAIIAHLSDAAVTTEPSPQRPLQAQELRTAQPVGASNESPVDAQAHAEVASPLQSASTAVSCEQATGAAVQVSLSGDPDESPVDARASDEVASPVQPATAATSCAQGSGNCRSGLNGG